jgi:hypothetical protein
MAIEMTNRSLTVLCDLNLLPSPADNIGQKIGLLLCNLGDLLAAQAERAGEAEQAYSLTREVYGRMRGCTAPASGSGCASGSGLPRRDPSISALVAASRGSRALDRETHAPLPLPLPLSLSLPLDPSLDPSAGKQQQQQLHVPAAGVFGVRGAETTSDYMYSQDIRYIDDMLEALAAKPPGREDCGSEEDGIGGEGCRIM